MSQEPKFLIELKQAMVQTEGVDVNVICEAPQLISGRWEQDACKLQKQKKGTWF